MIFEHLFERGGIKRKKNQKVAAFLLNFKSEDKGAELNCVNSHKEQTETLQEFSTLMFHCTCFSLASEADP